MKKLKLSGFDLGVIIAFAVLTLLGGSAYYYFSSALQTSTDDVHTADADFNKYSVASDIVVNQSNGKTLKADIDALQAQLNPLIQTKLLPKDSKLASIAKEDPVAWKHDLDDEVTRLKDMAKTNHVDVPPNFYFGFSRYQNNSPLDDQTLVLSKQLQAVDLLTSILLQAQVKNIQAIRRSYEEDSHGDAPTGPSTMTDPDRANGYAVKAPGNDYIAYPYEFDFVTTPEALRTIINKLVQSPSIFVLRSVTITNSNTDSPKLNDITTMVDAPPPNPTNSSPGEVAATTSTKGPQLLFGNETITVKIRVDMIEWMTKASE
jgi:hypothetical protein